MIEEALLAAVADYCRRGRPTCVPPASQALVREGHGGTQHRMLRVAEVWLQSRWHAGTL